MAKRGRPPGSEGPTRRFNRGFAAAAREMVPPELYVQFQFAILQGYDAILVEDERCTSTGGWRIEHRQGGQVPNLDQRVRAMTDLRTAAYGLPAQQILLDAQVKQQAMMAVVGVDARALDVADVAGRAEMLAAIERALGTGEGGGTPSLDEGEGGEVSDAEWTEGGASSSTDDDEGGAESSKPEGGASSSTPSDSDHNT